MYEEREAELWRQAEAEARESEEQREGEVLAAIFEAYLDGLDCGHLDEYREEVGGETFCMRCRDEKAAQIPEP